MATQEIRIDRTKTLLEEPDDRAQPLASGHPAGGPLRAGRRGHPRDPRRVRRADGPVGDAGDRRWRPNLDVVHPLTGPVYVEGAEPGDLLEVEIVEVEPDSYGYTVQVPGFGFLRDAFPDPFMVRWDIADGWATSRTCPACGSPARRSWAPSA